MELYQIKDLTFSYPGGENPALTGINLSVCPGEFITLCGASGCGKTTLLRLLKPELSPSGERAGEVLFEGQELSAIDARVSAGDIGFVMQNPENQIVTDKVWHELAFGLESLGVSTPEIRARVSEMAAFFGIDGWFHQKVADLSGGQKQLLNLASVMALFPKVLILDEPTSQLDPIAARDFLQTLHRINRELGITVILAEHRLEEVVPMADRVLVLEQGKLLADAKPREVGGILRQHPLFHGLPTPIRIHDAVESDTPCPLTVREGRLWLEEYADRNPIDGNNIPKTAPASGPEEMMLEAKELWFRYQKEGRDVLKNFSLSIKKGEIYGLLGGNGAGKSTALSLLAGIQRPLAGTVLAEGKPLSKRSDWHRGLMGVLPQDPTTLFIEKTVRLELEDFGNEENLSHQERENRLQKVAKFCRIQPLLSRHPYDLSGGEQRRVALAKLLLGMPKILLLDEPTGGMDAGFKREFGELLQSLAKQGMTVVMVSHDMEFCAEYAHRCGLLFDGSITAEAESRQFFSGNTFYTTAASRMARGVLPDAVLAEDVILACGGRAISPIQNPEQDISFIAEEETKTEEPTPKQKRGFWRVFLGVLSAVLFLLTCMRLNNLPPEANTSSLQLLSILELGVLLSCLLPAKKRTDAMSKHFVRGKPKARTWIAAGLILLAVPLTLLGGLTLFGERRYYLTSVLILAETLLPFLIAWEKGKKTARELVLAGVLSALAVGGRMAFSFLPQFKPMLALVILTGIYLGGETGFLVGATSAFVSNFFLGQGPWTPWQMLATGMVGYLAGLLTQSRILPRKREILCVFGFLATIVIYGGITNPIYLILYQENPTLEMLVSTYAMGFPFDLVHAASTGFFLWVLQNPMEEKLLRMKSKYGL